MRMTPWVGKSIPYRSKAIRASLRPDRSTKRADARDQSSARRDQLLDPCGQDGDEVRVDLMEHRRLAVQHLCAGLFQSRPRTPPPLDLDYGIERAVPDRHRRQGRGEVELEPGNDR